MQPIVCEALNRIIMNMQMFVARNVRRFIFNDLNLSQCCRAEISPFWPIVTDRHA